MNDEQRIVEAILELNNFLIKYKLKQREFSHKDPELSKVIENNRIDTFKFIIENFDYFDEIFLKFKKSYNYNDLKNFLQIIRNKRKDNFDYIETPFLINFQRSNYLKGKLALYSGHFSKAFLFFNKSMEKQVVCDARIIKSSIKQIYKIIKRVEINLDKKLASNNIFEKEIMSSHLEIPKENQKSSKK